ncbi:MAG: hypothetical protein OXC00_02600, partial [Acidimicrobiaceae bacterium]|nr:hypothetical protein [Acidimicrobiaceae bacterium]
MQHRVGWSAVTVAALVALSCGSGSSEPVGAPNAPSESVTSGAEGDGSVPADDPPVVETVPPPADWAAESAESSVGSADAAGVDEAGAGDGAVVFEAPLAAVDCPAGVPPA